MKTIKISRSAFLKKEQITKMVHTMQSTVKKKKYILPTNNNLNNINSNNDEVSNLVNGTDSITIVPETQTQIVDVKLLEKKPRKKLRILLRLPTIFVCLLQSHNCTRTSSMSSQTKKRVSHNCTRTSSMLYSTVAKCYEKKVAGILMSVCMRED